MEILRVENLSKDFGGVSVLQNVSFSVQPGERLLVIGPNGAGKTTLFNLIGGQLPPTSGRLFYEGRDITGVPAHRRAHMGIVRSFQLSTLLVNQTVMENALLTFLGCHPHCYEMFRPVRAQKDLLSSAEQALALADLWDCRHMPVKLLSYGDRRRLEVVLSIAQQPKLLLLDEPSNGLTSEESAAIVRLIKKAGKEMTVIVVAHDMDLVFEIAERINVLYYGGLIASGTPDEIRNNPKVREIYMGLGEACGDA
jgi:branched-chain amino acid transport system ATP-binding protein